METAVGIFVNGITGVFIGMTLLYLAMKLIELLSSTRGEPEETE